jgi:hypothetical protein
LKARAVENPNRQRVAVKKLAIAFFVFRQSRFRQFALRNVIADGDVLMRFAAFVRQRNNRCVNPVKRAIFSAIANFPAPDFTARDGFPEILN